MTADVDQREQTSAAGVGADSSHGRAVHAQSKYARFGAMILSATAVMYLLTYTNLYSLAHFQWSQERFYMALGMGGAMAAVMMGFMWRMHTNARVNIAIVVGALVVMVGAFSASQAQLFVEDEDYMKGMIPHHSIAILTSERATIHDVRVQELAEEIIRAQRREIKEMEWLLDDIEENGIATSDAEAEDRPVPEFAPTR